VYRSTISEDEKYFLDHVQSFIVGGKWRNEWEKGEMVGKRYKRFVKRDILWYFIRRGIGSCALARGRERTRKLSQSCCSKMWITRPVNFHFSMNDYWVQCIFIFEKRAKRTKFDYQEFWYNFDIFIILWNTKKKKNKLYKLWNRYLMNFS